MKKKVFISWSGKTSSELAKILRKWLPSVIQGVEAIYSEDDIEKGSRGNRVMDEELEAADVGILCLTQDNIDSRWILYEAGSLAKKSRESRVCPLLFGGLKKTDLKAPLSNLQGSVFSKEDVRKMLNMINNQFGEEKLKAEVLDSVFEKFWPDLEREVKNVLSKAGKEPQKELRSERDMIEELLGLVRSMSQELSAQKELRPVMRWHRVVPTSYVTDGISEEEKERLKARACVLLLAGMPGLETASQLVVESGISEAAAEVIVRKAIREIRVAEGKTQKEDGASPSE